MGFKWEIFSILPPCQCKIPWHLLVYVDCPNFQIYNKPECNAKNFKVESRDRWLSWNKLSIVVALSLRFESNDDNGPALTSRDATELYDVSKHSNK